VTAVTVVLAGFLAWGGVWLFSGSSTTSSNTPSAISSSAPVSQPAKAALQRAISTAESKGSFHYVSSTTGGGSEATTIGEAGRSSGIQHITMSDPSTGTMRFTVVVVGTTAYFRGGATAMEQNLDMSAAAAAAHANQWISLAPSDGAVYASVYAAVNTHDALSENIALKPQQLGTTTSGDKTYDTVSGALVPVSIPGEGTQNVTGTGTLEISQKTHLPVRFVEHSGSGRQKTTFTITFSRFGETVSETAPSGALSFSSVGGASGGNGGNGGNGGGGGGSTNPTVLT
jgi:hypothetical protein